MSCIKSSKKSFLRHVSTDVLWRSLFFIFLSLIFCFFVFFDFLKHLFTVCVPCFFFMFQCFLSFFYLLLLYFFDFVFFVFFFSAFFFYLRFFSFFLTFLFDFLKKSLHSDRSMIRRRKVGRDIDQSIKVCEFVKLIFLS